MHGLLPLPRSTDHKDQKKPEQGTEVLKFFDWAYKTGAKQVNDTDYASLPDSVVEQVRAA